MDNEIKTDDKLRELSTFDNQLKRYEEKLEIKDEIIEEQGGMIDELQRENAELKAKLENK